MKVIDYYFSPVSPWTYLGHGRVAEMAARHGATINAKPVDYGVIFPVSGGLPLGKRAPQRQAYRLMELARWRDHLGLPLTIQPKFFPVDGTQAAYLICGAPEATRMAVAGDLLAAVWAREVVAPPINSGTVNPSRSISLATCAISSSEGVMSPDRPMTSAFSAFATSRIFCADTITPRFTTS